MVDDALAKDLDALHRPPHRLLIELERRAEEDGVPVVSRATGRFLSTIVAAMQAHRILDVGAGYGYATLWMALAQPGAGRIWAVEPDERRAAVARSYFQRAGEEDSIELFRTPARELLENFPHRNLDVAYVDATEAECASYLDLVVPTLKLSGLAIFNRAAEMRAFARAFLDHPALDATILPFGIGIGARRQ